MMNEENLVKKYSVRTDLACDKGFNKKICEEKTVESSGIIINKYKEENGNEVNYYYNIGKDTNRNIYRVLLLFQLKFLNFIENIGISEIRK